MRWYYLLLLLPFALGLQVEVTVDANEDRHWISPLIYGLNFATQTQITYGKVTLTRWGGNRASRYNYLHDMTNRAFDSYFQNIPECWDSGRTCFPRPTDTKFESAANEFLLNAMENDIDTSFTLPMMGWMTKGPPKYEQPFPCSCTNDTSPNQDGFDPFNPTCGNGFIDGVMSANCTPSLTSEPTPEGWVGDWIDYITSLFGKSNGRRIYQLDNEPNLWHDTHHDVFDHPATYTEIWEKSRDTALEIIKHDATAPISGPGEWGWKNYICSAADYAESDVCTADSPDRAAHGGLEFVPWLLQQAQAWELTHGQRLLHYLDLHYYPAEQTSEPRRTRSLWDPTYIDPSYINLPIALIPRMRKWVEDYYPGTKLMIGEYDWGYHSETGGELTYTEALGIFAREGLHAATAWNPPDPSSPAFSAWKFFRNYDRQGSGFQSVNVRATVDVGDTSVQAFASIGSNEMTLIVVNEGPQFAIDVNLVSFRANGLVRIYYRSTGSEVDLEASMNVTGTSFSLGYFPSRAVRLFVIEGTPDDPIATTSGSATTGPFTVVTTGETEATTGGESGTTGQTGTTTGSTSTTPEADDGCGNATRTTNKVSAPFCNGSVAKTWSFLLMFTFGLLSTLL